MDHNKFYFKQFSVAHTRSSLKVGVDGVLVGLWSEPRESRRVLDVGTGCGVIALIVAQLTDSDRSLPQTLVDAIDIDEPSIAEAKENFRDSPWNERLCASLSDLRDWPEGDGYDLIVSNPPFFRSGIGEVRSARLAARHQESLPLADLLGNCRRLLSDGGRTVIILPYEFREEAVAEATKIGLHTGRICRVRGHERAPWKRVLLEFFKRGAKSSDSEAVRQMENYSSESENHVSFSTEESLTLETSPGVPTDEYRRLGKDFYLRF